jgi:hypothetical protein
MLPIARAAPNLTSPASPAISDRARWVYIVLLLFLGTLGVHNFYRRCYARGYGQLFAWPAVALWLFVFPVIPWRATTEQDPNFVLKTTLLWLAPAVALALWLFCELFATEDRDGRNMN